MVLIALFATTLAVAGVATAADRPVEAGAVGVGVTERLGTQTYPRAHLMAWMRPADWLGFGVGLGHATTASTQDGVSLRLEGLADLPVWAPGPLVLSLEGGAVMTLGIADQRPAATLGPASRVVLHFPEPRLAIAVGWAPELHLLPEGQLEGGALDLALRGWF